MRLQALRTQIRVSPQAADRKFGKGRVADQPGVIALWLQLRLRVPCLGFRQDGNLGVGKCALWIKSWKRTSNWNFRKKGSELKKTTLIECSR